MKKKMLIMTVLAALVAVPVFAATTDQGNLQEQGKSQKLEKINKHENPQKLEKINKEENPQDQSRQMNVMNQQMIQEAVKDGTISSEEATILNESMQKIAPIMQKIMKKHGMMQNIQNNGQNNKTQSDKL